MIETPTLDRFVILTAAEAGEIIAPADPDSLAHLGQGLYRARWIGVEIPADEVIAVTTNPRVVIALERPLDPHPDADGAYGFEMQFRISEAAQAVTN